MQLISCCCSVIKSYLTLCDLIAYGAILDQWGAEAIGWMVNNSEVHSVQLLIRSLAETSPGNSSDQLNNTTLKSLFFLKCILLKYSWFTVLCFWCTAKGFSYTHTHTHTHVFSSVQSLNLVRLFTTPWTAASQASLSITSSRSWLKLMSIESVMPSNHLILCRPLLLPPSIFSSIRVFQISQLFTSGGQSIGVSASASILPMNIQSWFPLGLTGLISLLTKRLSRVFSNTTVQKHQFFGVQPSLWFNSQICTWLLEKL